MKPISFAALALAGCLAACGARSDLPSADAPDGGTAGVGTTGSGTTGGGGEAPVTCEIPSTPELIAEGEEGPTAIAVDATRVYWITPHALRSAPKCGGPAVTLGQN